MPSYRQGPGRLYSAQEAELLLPYPCFYVLTGSVVPVFPGTLPSNPSPLVTLIRTGLKVREKDTHRFPMFINADQWHTAVVPVLIDEQWEIKTPLFKRVLETGRIENELALIGSALRQSFISAGYGESE